MNILLIEDERALALGVIRTLKEDGYEVGWQSNGTDGLKAALTGDYDLVVLDLLLPGKNGWDVCTELRAADVNIPVLMLSALDEVRDKVKGLDLGAEDFLAKPFDPTELLARVRALLRKNMVHRGQVIRVGGLEIDRDSRRVVRDGIELDLTKSEFEILTKLASHEGLRIKPSELARNVPLSAEVIGDPFESCMAALRAKVDGPFSAPLIRVTEGDYLLCAVS